MVCLNTIDQIHKDMRHEHCRFEKSMSSIQVDKDPILNSYVPCEDKRDVIGYTFQWRWRTGNIVP